MIEVWGAQISSAVLAAAAVGYGFGSVPFGWVLARLGGFGDIRAIGSGNIGATNVLRTGSIALAGATLVLDAGKGAAAVLAGAAIGGSPAAVAAGVGALFGHLFPVWLKLGSVREAGGALLRLAAVAAGFGLVLAAWGGGPFALTAAGAALLLALAGLAAWGGKGVATALGVLAAAAWPVGLAAGLVWLAAALISRRSSASAVAAMVAAPGFAAWFGGPEAASFAAIVAAVVLVRHVDNLRRLVRGEEPPIRLDGRTAPR